MIDKRELKGLTKTELKLRLADESLTDITNLVYDLLKPQEDTPKITLTPSQFEQHFQISQELGRRGRPRKSSMTFSETVAPSKDPTLKTLRITKEDQKEFKDALLRKE